MKQPERGVDRTEQSQRDGCWKNKERGWTGSYGDNILRIISVTYALETIYILHKNFNEYLQYFSVLSETRMSDARVCVCVWVWAWLCMLSFSGCKIVKIDFLKSK